METSGTRTSGQVVESTEDLAVPVRTSLVLGSARTSCLPERGDGRQGRRIT